MTIIQYLQAWFSTQDAEDFLKMRNPDVELILTPVHGQGILMEVRPAGTDKVFQIGIAPQDAVRLARYMMAVAHVLGANVNEGIAGVVK